jgi:hypothetical protein
VLRVAGLWCTYVLVLVYVSIPEPYLNWYGKHGPVKVVRGKVHEYPGMRFDLSVKEKE